MNAAEREALEGLVRKWEAKSEEAESAGAVDYADCFLACAMAVRSLLSQPAPVEEQEPTPESLRALAQWFDNLNKSPGFALKFAPLKRMTPGFLVREIADALETAYRHPAPAKESK